MENSKIDACKYWFECGIPHDQILKKLYSVNETQLARMFEEYIKQRTDSAVNVGLDIASGKTENPF